MKRHAGSCLCGGIKFTIEGELAPIQVCHCLQCRKAQGTALATNVPVARDDFRVDEGDALLASYESSPGKHRVFCRRCGSPVLSRRDALPGVVRVRLGLLEGPVEAGVQAHYFVGSKANWWSVCDGAPQFSQGPDSARVD